jgi:serine/threonine protein kinase
MILKKRFDKAIKIIKLLESIETLSHNVCINSYHEFTDNLDKLDEIAAGKYGTAYFAEINGRDFVIKEVIIGDDNDLERIKNDKQSNILAKEAYTSEFKIMDQLTDYVKSGGFPNFLMSYYAGVCETCGYFSDNVCFLSFMELAVGDLKHFSSLRVFNDPDIMYSVVYQLFLAMCSLHFRYGIHHRDIKVDNILYLKIKPGGYFRYIIDDKEYLVRNYGYLFCIHDFGISSVYNPKCANGPIYGTRNARVRDDGKLEPITCKKGITIKPTTERLQISNEPTEIIWENSRKNGTNNYFVENLPIEPDQDVDLEDTKQFPPFEFFNDLQNLIGLFTGVSGYVVFDMPYHKEQNKQIHDKNLFVLPRKLQNKLESLQLENFVYDTNYAILLRADMMLDYLYEKPKVPESDIVGTFYV